MPSYEYPSGERLNALVKEFRAGLVGSPADIARGLYSNGRIECLSQEVTSIIETRLTGALGVNKDSLVIVGSARLGFTIKNIQERPRYSPFGANSDVDIAIVDSSLFDAVWSDVWDHFVARNSWHAKKDFQHYFFRGWIRPDKLPYRFPRRDEWFDLFRDLGRSIDRGAHSYCGGIYKSTEFLIGYQSILIAECKRQEELSL